MAELRTPYHRAALINGELVVVYQLLRMKEGAGPEAATGPAEQWLEDQSLLLARFTADGTELFRGPIVAHVADREEDNFPDHCLLWRDGRLLVSTGWGGGLKIREVDLESNILVTHLIKASRTTVPGSIGNNLLHDGDHLLMFSGGPNGYSALTVSRLTDGAGYR